jgi:hypothetical protein
MNAGARPEPKGRETGFEASRPGFRLQPGPWQEVMGACAETTEQPVTGDGQSEITLSYSPHFEEMAKSQRQSTAAYSSPVWVERIRRDKLVFGNEHHWVHYQFNELSRVSDVEVVKWFNSWVARPSL